MAEITLRASGLRTYADDIGIAFMNMSAQLRAVLDMLDQWGGASALRLNTWNCRVVTVGEVSVAEALIRQLPRHSDMAVSRAEKYL